MTPEEYQDRLFAYPRPWWYARDAVQGAKHHKPRNVRLTGKAYTFPGGNVARTFVQD
jgi:hypothetical protein